MRFFDAGRREDCGREVRARVTGAAVFSGGIRKRLKAKIGEN